MDSSTARRLYADHAHALAYVDVEKPNGDRNIGSAFHVGEGVFVTARHIVEGNKIVEVKITEPVALNTREYFQEVYKGEFSDEDARKHDAACAIVLGYPPIPMVNEPRLIAAKVEIHTWVVPRHIQRVHFIVSGTPRGGFSGGVAIHESGHALGVITSSFGKDNQPEQLGFFAVLSIEGIVECLAQNKLFPEFQRKHYESLLGFDPTSILAMHASDKT
jgi:hypothetical protein